MLYLALVAISLGLATFLDLGSGDSADVDSSDPGDDTDGIGGGGGGEDGIGGGDGGGGDGGSGGGSVVPDPGSGSGEQAIRLTGTFDDDLFDLRGTSARYQVNGFEGADTVHLGQEGSTVYGGSGPDKVTGGFGDDFVYLGDGRDQFDEAGSTDTGNDLVRGGRGADKLTSRTGADTLWGDLGADDLYTLDDPDRPAQGDTAYGGFGKDRLWLDGGDIGYGGADADQFTLRTDSGVLGEPAVIGDFSAAEDVLIIDLPAGQTATHADLGFTGTDGTRITLILNGQPVAVLDNTWFEDLTEDTVLIR